MKAFAVDIRSQFDSLNGGISMCLPQLATYLVEHGIGEFLQRIQEESARTQDSKLQLDLHFLVKGVKSIDEAELENAIAFLREPYRQMKIVCSRHQQCVQSLEQAEHRWHSAAEKAKYQLEAWGQWAYETEDARSKKWLFVGTAVPNFGLYFTFRGGWDVLDAPQNLRSNFAYFKSRVDAIKDVISSSYIAEELPKNLSLFDLDRAIDSLEEHQEQVNQLSSAVIRASEEWKCVNDSYSSKRQQLLKLLWQMPEAAHWAVFRICRPDLRESYEA